MGELVRVDLELTKKDLQLLCEFIGNTDVFFVEESVEALGLTVNGRDLDLALFRLYNQLHDTLNGGSMNAKVNK